MGWFERFREKLRRKREPVVDAGEDESFFERTAVQRQRDSHRYWWSRNGHRVIEEMTRLQREQKRREEEMQAEKVKSSPVPSAE